jgi:hypothetical protein
MGRYERPSTENDPPRTTHRTESEGLVNDLLSRIDSVLAGHELQRTTEWALPAYPRTERFQCCTRPDYDYIVFPDGSWHLEHRADGTISLAGQSVVEQ